MPDSLAMATLDDETLVDMILFLLYQLLYISVAKASEVGIIVVQNY